MGQEKFTSVAVAVLCQEADGLHALADSLGTDFDEAVECLLHLSGRIAVTGRVAMLPKKSRLPYRPQVAPPFLSIRQKPATETWACWARETLSWPSPIPATRTS